MSLCHCVYKMYYRYFAFKDYVIKRICLFVIVSIKYIIVPLSLDICLFVCVM